jgi:beta-galactosidase
MLIGASYYSECWPAERWSVDAELMQAAGLNVVRMGEFAWSRFQPTADQYEFDWMDACIGHMRAHGIQTLLGVPTRVAPPWLVDQDPSMLIVSVDGRRVAYGGRYEFCLNHAGYRAAAAALVAALAEHYRDQDGILAWHLDNEYGIGVCYCDRCAAAFQSWLRTRYSSISELNRAWGTVYWSTEYTDWRQIGTPRLTENRQNPAMHLDFRRYWSDLSIDFARMAADTIRATGDRRPLTTNTLSNIDHITLDYFQLSELLDVAAANNNFPHADAGQMNLDLVHGLKRRRFWSVEQRASGGGVPIVTPISRPGDMRRWTYLTIGHGADAVLYWAWRRYTLGQEQYWGGILDHDGQAGRFYEEVRQTTAELRRLAPVLDGTDTEPDVGLVVSYDSRWALDVELNHPELGFERLAHAFWKPLRGRGMTCEFTRPTADLSRYRLVIVPTLLLVDEPSVGELRRYVEQGGTLLLTPRCGVKDSHNTIAIGDLLERWRALTGVRVTEESPLMPPATGLLGQLHRNYETVDLTSTRGEPLQRIRAAPGFLGGGTYPARTWSEVLENLPHVEVLATYELDYCAGRPAATRHRLGNGQVITLGTLLEPAGQRELIDWLLAEAGLRSPIDTPDGLEVLVRRGANGPILLVLNHADTDQTLALPGPVTDLLDEQPVQGTLVVPARGVSILLGTEASGPTSGA